MHNMTIALHKKGYHITGSDDAIYEPAKSRLQKYGLLPEPGWDASRITPELDAVILGMHARKDNPELLRAQELGIKIFSFPEFIYENSRNKTRVVIGGSHGKTTTTAMVMYVLKALGKPFDYMVGSQVEGFETMVQLTDEAPVIILEGDEYLSSPIDLRPKFHLYRPHIALLTGVAWDHINVFPTFENYVEQFDIFVRTMAPGTSLFYFNGDPYLQKIAAAHPHVKSRSYGTPEYSIDTHNQTQLEHNGTHIPLQIFGEHNLQNMEGARCICNALGVTDEAFYNAIKDFTGAARRLERIHTSGNLLVYRDFAHSPSKLKSTVKAVHTQYPNHRMIAVFELHTFSSLDAHFLPEYKNSMDDARHAIVFFDEETLKQKNRELTVEEVQDVFGPHVQVINQPGSLQQLVHSLITTQPTVLLLMSSGTFGGISWEF